MQATIGNVFDGEVTLIMHNFVLPQVPESSVSLGKGQKRKAVQMSKAITIGSSPILYTQNTVSTGTVKLR